MLGATCTIFRAGAVPGAPGARRGPQGAENRPKTRSQIYHLILPKVQSMVVGSLRAAARWATSGKAVTFDLGGTDRLNFQRVVAASPGNGRARHVTPTS